MNTNEREFPVAMLADGLFYDVLGDGRARYLSTALEKQSAVNGCSVLPSMMKAPISCLRQSTISEISNHYRISGFINGAVQLLHCDIDWR